MYIEHDYHYINTNENLLIEKGYGKISIHSILIGIIQKNRRKRIDRLQNL